jgi:hypothetical protein
MIKSKINVIIGIILLSFIVLGCMKIDSKPSMEFTNTNAEPTAEIAVCDSVNYAIHTRDTSSLIRRWEVGPPPSAVILALYEGGLLVISGNGSINSNNILSNLKFRDYVTAIEIQDGITQIGNGAFFDYPNLVSVTIPTTVTHIEHEAFGYCTSLTSVIIPGSVISIGNHVFNRCHNLTAINVMDSNAEYASVDGVLFNKSKNILIRYPPGKQDSAYIIPHDVESISAFAFTSAKLKSLTIPQSVATIKRGAFWECDSLMSVTVLNVVPPELEEIGTFRRTSRHRDEEPFTDCPPERIMRAITIFAPLVAINDYKNAQYWKEYKISCIDCDDGTGKYLIERATKVYIDFGYRAIITVNKKSNGGALVKGSIISGEVEISEEQWLKFITDLYNCGIYEWGKHQYYRSNTIIYRIVNTSGDIEGSNNRFWRIKISDEKDVLLQAAGCNATPPNWNCFKKTTDWLICLARNYNKNRND